VEAPGRRHFAREHTAEVDKRLLKQLEPVIEVEAGRVEVALRRAAPAPQTKRPPLRPWRHIIRIAVSSVLRSGSWSIEVINSTPFVAVAAVSSHINPSGRREPRFIASLCQMLSKPARSIAAERCIRNSAEGASPVSVK
jgi:hypothetical protein